MPSGYDDVLRPALEAARLPADDLDQPGRTFFELCDEQGPIGFVGRESDGADRLLRSLVVLLATSGDSKLRGRDVVSVRIGDVVSGGRVHYRALIVQRKSKRPIQFETMDTARKTMRASGLLLGASATAHITPAGTCAGS